MMSDFQQKKSYGLTSNKDMIINDIYGIDIDNFRLFENEQFNLGKHVTIVSGRNGTMKSTLMGLVAHPYRTTEKDINNKYMHTNFSDVFRLSTEKDKNDYLYHIKLNIDNNLKLKEPIPLYFQPGNENTLYSKKDRHRLVPSGRNKGDGYFSLPSVYINLKRLYPLIESGELSNEDISYSEKEKEFVRVFFQKVLLRNEFKNFEKYSTNEKSLSKNPYGPENTYYDVNSISSGEDNLSTFADILISFMRVHDKNKEKGYTGLTSILSIDEFEASLHPIAQTNLFEFILKWSARYRVKVILNTHSLYLIQHVYLQHQKKLDAKFILINFIGSQFQEDNKLVIFENPDYKLAYSELTLTNYEEKNKLMKVKILCEDDVAKLLIKRILSKQSLTSQIIISHVVSEDNDGISSNLLSSLCRNLPLMLKETKSMVIFDADIDIESQKLNKFAHAFSLPSLYNLPFEKEIVQYILSLKGNDKFFVTFKKSKETFLQSFSNYNIDIDFEHTNFQSQDVKHFKKWYSENKKDASKYMSYYIQQNKDKENFLEFKYSVLNSVNEIRINHGFAPIEIEF